MGTRSGGPHRLGPLTAQLSPPGTALITPAAAEVVVHHDRSSDPAVRYLRADLHHHARRFMACDHGPGEPGASIDVEVRAAHPGRFHRDNDLAVARHRVGERLDIQLVLAVEHDCLHAAPLGLPPRGLQMFDPPPPGSAS